MQITWLQDTNCGQENDQSHRHSRSMGPVTRYQSPKWHINIIARDCGRRPRGISQSLRIFALPASLCDCQTHKGRSILIFPLSFLLLVFLFFFIFVVLSTLWTFTQGLAYLRACESAKNKKKMGKVRNSLTFISPIASWTRAEKNTIIKKQKEEWRAQSVM